MHLVTDIAQDVIQELDGTFTGAHTTDHTEVDMLAAASQVLVTHELSDLEQLSSVQVLLGGNDVDHLVEVELLVTLDNSTDITGQVQRSTVLADNDSLAKLLGAVLGEVDNNGTIRLLGDAALLHGAVGRGHALVLDLGLSRVDVKVDVQTGVSRLVLLDTELTESLPEGESIRFAVLHALEVPTGLLVLAGIDQLLQLSLLSGHVLALLLLGLNLLLELLDRAILLRHNVVDLDIHIEQVVDRVLGELLLITKVLEAVGEQTILLTPVTEVVHLDHIPAHDGVQVGKETTNNGTPQVTGVEGLGDVGRRELDDDLLAALGGVRGVPQTLVSVGTIGSAVLEDAAEDGVHQRLRPEEELEVNTSNAGRLDEVGFGELLGEFLAEFLGVLLDSEGWDLVYSR